MKTIFDQTARKELIGRIHTLDENNTAQWGENEYPTDDKALHHVGRSGFGQKKGQTILLEQSFWKADIARFCERR